MCIYGTILLKHAPLKAHTFLYAHAHRSGAPPLTAVKLGPCSPLSHCSALASSALMLARVGESRMSLTQSLD